MDSNKIWKDESNFNNWELRSHRFTDIMLPVFLQYLRINPNHNVLDAGCGTGVFTRYLAKGLGTGKIDGIDISEALVEYGNHKIKESNLSSAKLIQGDGYSLPYDDESFDAVTNYTYLGVLSDPIRGLKEMIRVCKTGGAVSSVVATTRIPPVTWEGDYPFEWNKRLTELYDKQQAIHSDVMFNTQMYAQSEEWHPFRYPKMFEECGLENISIYPVAHGFSYNDKRWSLECRKIQIDAGLKDKIRYITERSKLQEYANRGLASEDFAELIKLLEKKRQYLLEHLKSDRSWEWSAQLDYIVVGDKQK